MRRSYDCKFIVNEGDVIGFSFGSGVAAEHQMGIDSLRTSLGMDSNAIGLDRSIVHEFQFPLDVYEREDEMVVIFDPSIIGVQTKFRFSISDMIRWNELTCWGNMPVSAAWDDASFGIHVLGKENVELLKNAVVEPWNDHDAALLVCQFKDYLRPGLVFLRASKLPEDDRKEMREKHLDYIALQKASDKIGIHDALKKAGKGFYALDPQWAKDFTTIETKYPVVYWLNPMYQMKNNRGYFSVEDLEQWIEGRGPIPKNI